MCLEDDAGAEEPDARDHALDHAIGRGREQLDREPGERRRPEREQREGPIARGLASPLALEPDQEAERGRERDPSEQSQLQTGAHLPKPSRACPRPRSATLPDPTYDGRSEGWIVTCCSDERMKRGAPS